MAFVAGQLRDWLAMKSGSFGAHPRIQWRYFITFSCQHREAGKMQSEKMIQFAGIILEPSESIWVEKQRSN
jgi:hypothetical protein